MIIGFENRIAFSSRVRYGGHESILRKIVRFSKHVFHFGAYPFTRRRISGSKAEYHRCIMLHRIYEISSRYPSLNLDEIEIRIECYVMFIPSSFFFFSFFEYCNSEEIEINN